ncbi:MAG TPA: hypothetical protein VE086_08180 [Chthoniobacterales bacterium]|nr:hypothetical protein [Chthoniobacterales bacterium]
MPRALAIFSIGLVLMCGLLLNGCLDGKELIRKFAPKEDDEFARLFIERIRTARYEEAQPMLEPTVAQKAGADGLVRLHQIVDHGEPISVELIGANVGYLRPWDKSAASRQANLTYQLQFRDAWVVATMVVQNNDKGRQLVSAFFQPLPDSLEVLNRFTLKNKSIHHYLFFAAVICVPLFILFVLIVCIRSRVRFRWLWIVFIVLGFVQFRLNWTTGAWDVQPASINLFGASFMRGSSYAPWILTVSIPLGAALFLVLRSRLPRKDSPPPITPTPMSAPPSP